MIAPILAATATGGRGFDVKKIAITASIVVVAVVIFFVVRKQIKKHKEKKLIESTNNVTGEAGLANVLADRARTAMKGWGTNEKALYDIAAVLGRGETTFEKVSSAFYAKFGRNLANDIRSELTSKELKKFYDIIGLPVGGIDGLTNLGYLT